MAVLPSPTRPSGLRRAWQVVLDLLIATALLWVPTLLLAALGAALEFLWQSR